MTTVDGRGRGLALTDEERGLLAAWRQARSGHRRELDEVERGVLDRWRAWSADPTKRPLWAAALRDTVSETDGDTASGVGVQQGRLLGMVLGAAAGEGLARGSPEPVGPATSALVFALDGLVRAGQEQRTTGHSDPALAVHQALRRWLRVHSTGPVSHDGWVPAEPALRPALIDDVTFPVALSGTRPGTWHDPATDSDTATALPIGALAALWPEADRSHGASPLGVEFAALTHGHPNGYRPAGIAAEALRHVLNGRSLGDRTTHLTGGRAQDARAARQAIRLARQRPPGRPLLRRHVEAMRTGNPAIDALAIALRIAVVHEDDIRAALRLAADHDGDRVTSAVLCGQFLGALHGPAAIPPELVEHLPITRIAIRLTEDAAEEFHGTHKDAVPQTTRSHEVVNGYPTPVSRRTEGVSLPSGQTGLPAPPRLAESRDRFTAAILGGAIGEAFGTPIVGETWQNIQSRHGKSGLREYVPAGSPSGRVGSDTQLLLFTLEGVVRAHVGHRRSPISDPSRHVQHALQRWLHTQHLSWGRAAGEFLTATPQPDGWLVEQRALFQTRAPGRTLMQTLLAFAKNQRSIGTPHSPGSDSDGSGALLRAVPAALWSSDPAEVFRVGVSLTALTHGAPDALLSGGTLAVIVSRLLHGDDLPRAVRTALAELSEHEDGERSRVHARVRTAALNAESGPLSHRNFGAMLGSGATASEALAIGVHAALAARGAFSDALRIAVNHDGVSDTCGAIAGAIAGAAGGTSRIPWHWVTELELADVVERLAHDAGFEFGPLPPRQPDWSKRYPPT